MMTTDDKHAAAPAAAAADDEFGDASFLDDFDVDAAVAARAAGKGGCGGGGGGGLAVSYNNKNSAVAGSSFQTSLSLSPSNDTGNYHPKPPKRAKVSPEHPPPQTPQFDSGAPIAKPWPHCYWLWFEHKERPSSFGACRKCVRK